MAEYNQGTPSPLTIQEEELIALELEDHLMREDTKKRINAPGRTRPGGVHQGCICLSKSVNWYPHKKALGEWSSQHAATSGVSSREVEAVNPSSFQGSTVTRQTTMEEEEPLQVQLRRQFVFFPHLIPQELQAAVRDLDVMNCHELKKCLPRFTRLFKRFVT